MKIKHILFTGAAAAIMGLSVLACAPAPSEPEQVRIDTLRTRVANEPTMGPAAPVAQPRRMASPTYYAVWAGDGVYSDTFDRAADCHLRRLVLMERHEMMLAEPADTNDWAFYCPR